MPKLAPGPSGRALDHFIQRQHDPINLLSDLFDEYGSVFHFRALHLNVLGLMEPDLISEVLVSKAKSFQKTPILKKASVVFGERSVLIIEGEDHARLRRLIQPAFHRKRIEGYAQIMVRHAESWQDAWASGDERNVHTEMVGLTQAIVTEALFGNAVAEDAQKVGDAIALTNAHFHLLSMPLGPLWKHLPLPGPRKLKAAIETIDETIMRLVEDRRSSGRDEGDLLSMLLAAQDTEGGKEPLTNEEVHDQVATLFLAGHETTANTLTWCAYLLAKNPAVQAKLREEVRAVVGDRPPSFEDVPQLKYTRAVMAEAMRVYPAVWSMGRHAMEDVTLGDYHVEAGTLVIMSQYIVHNDPRWWKDPIKFQPERWLEDPQPARPKFAYFPFGGGARVCAGEAFAWMEGVLLLASLIRRWNVSLCEQTDDPPSLQAEITLSPAKGMTLRLDAA